MCNTLAEREYYATAVKRQRAFKNCAGILLKEGIVDLESPVQNKEG